MQELAFLVFSDIFFLLFFLPLQLVVCALFDETKKRNVALLCFSLFFYAWGEPMYVFLLVGMTFADWFFSLLIASNRGKRTAKLALIGAIITSLGLLSIFKYTGFFAENLQALFGVPENIPHIPLPIGISFYTFQLLTYVIDVYRGNAKCATKFHELLLYASLFHQCIAGPIIRYTDVHREIRLRKKTVTNMGKGVQRFAVGLAKKALLANSCGAMVDMILLPDSQLSDLTRIQENLAVLSSRPVLLVWLGMLFFMLQIYLDFSAYSDMAIGMGLMEGFHYKENFNYPYTASTVTEFWRCWHISLSTFFRDYVYIPLGGNRKGIARTIFNLLVVWLLTGFWHGASWNFILWGLYYFVFLVLEKYVLLKKLKKIPAFVRRFGMLVVVYFGWVLFRFTRMAYVGVVLKGLFGLNHSGFTNFEASTVLKNNLFFLIVCIVAATPLVHNLRLWIEEKAKYSKSMLYVKRVVFIVLPAALLVLSVLSLVGNSYNPFLYFQF